MELRTSMKSSNGYGLKVNIPPTGPNMPVQGNVYGGSNNFVSPRSTFNIQSPLSANPNLGFNRSMDYNK